VAGKEIEWCRVALEETRRAQKIVRDFDIFSRAEAFERPDLLSGTELAQKLGEAVKQGLTRANTKIEVCVDPNLPLVKVNLDRLSDDFANFVRDSECHRPAGLCITITCELVNEPDQQLAELQIGNTYLKLSYTDNGPGIPPGSKQRVFEPFYTTTGGSGLGLAIAKHDAHVHGGTLVECGQPGKGVQFDLYLPIMKAII
ncbi:MAG: HAMP domain-containing histidine kinase, partial [Nitrososphaera sp.]|nr:HAMP domain-containing histidine kinase [Nitrososphaera sp.]